MRKIGILALLFLITGIFAYTCYQETANISTCGATAGNYAITPNTIYINYTKPVNAVNATWQMNIRTQNDVPINYTIPTSCFSYGTNLMLKLYSYTSADGSGVDNLTASCYNGTWVTVASNVTIATIAAYTDINGWYMVGAANQAQFPGYTNISKNVSPYLLIDGNWSTGAMYSSPWNDWVNMSAINVSQVYEEGIWWDITIPPPINPNITQQTAISNIYILKNNTISNYPRVNETFKCAADIFPANGVMITKVSWTITSGVGGILSSSSTGVQRLDKQSWETSANFTANASGILTCLAFVQDSVGNVASLSKTFTITYPLPTCSGEDCNITGSQDIPYINGFPSYRYRNINISGTLTYGLAPASTSPSGYVIISADQRIDVSGSLLSEPTGYTAADTCSGQSATALTLQAQTITVSGIIKQKGNSGKSCGSQYSINGGNGRELTLQASDLDISGTVSIIGGSGGSYSIAGTAFSTRSGGSGGSVGPLYIYADNFRLTAGGINILGGNGSQAQNAFSSCSPQAGRGGDGGSANGIQGTGGVLNFSGGTYNIIGGNGGGGSTNSYSCGTNGGSGGSIYGNTFSYEKLYNTIPWSIKSGNGGPAAGNKKSSVCTGTNANTGTIAQTRSTMYNNSLTTGVVNSVSGVIYDDTITDCVSGSGKIFAGTVYSASAHLISYGTGTNLSNFSAYQVNGVSSSTLTNITPHSGPSGSINITYPLNNASIYAYPNITMTASASNASYATEIYWSLDNASWYVLPATYNLNPPGKPSNTTGYDPWYGSYGGVVGLIGWSMDFNRILYNHNSFNINEMNSSGRIVYFKIRQRYNNMFTPESIVSYQLIPRTLQVTNAWRSPNTTVMSIGLMTFYCKVNDTILNTSLGNTPVFVNVYGQNYSTLYDTTLGAYYYTQTIPGSAGTTNWSCIGWQPNYNMNSLAGDPFTYSDWYIDLPPRVTEIRLTCPFPTYNGIIPWGQTAGVGIFRVVNLNTTAYINISIATQDNVPNLKIYGRTNWSNVYNISTGTANDTLLTNIGQQIIPPIANSSSRYMWIYANCINATTGSYNTSYYFARTYS